MKEIVDADLLDSYLKKYNICSLFDTPDLPFRLYEYESGEMMNILHKQEDYIKFVVGGTYRIYAVREDGTLHCIAVHQEGFSLLGDVEFCGCISNSHYQEVVQAVRTVELPLYGLREILLNDNRFLRHILHLMGQKVADNVWNASRSNLEEVILYYLEHECTDHCISSVTDTAFRLNYSRAQLQRVLRELTQRGVLKKEGKGSYRLVR